jgi:two-component system, OmpR family, sensor histidine kinase TctE
VLREVALDLAPLMADKDLEFELETEAAPVLAHDWMLRELVRNVLHNAIKHSVQAGTLKVSLQGQQSFAVLVISDSGEGISHELRQRLFQPFSAGRVQAGAGLGLAICAEIVQALQGQIAVENRVRQEKILGLDVRVNLPLHQ